MEGDIVVILGGGITGLSTAYHLKEKGIEFTLIEKEDSPGGLCRTIQKDGYLFEYTGHFLHYSTDYVREFVKGLLPEIKDIERNSYVYLMGRLIPYPFQANLNYLPPAARIKAFLGYFFRSKGEPQNFEEWITVNFGKGMAELFFFPYNRKLWKYDLSKIRPEFLSDFVPEVHLKNRDNKLGYNVNFMHPEKGIGELISRISDSIDFIHGEVNKVDENYVYFNDEKVEYDYIVNTVPLPEFLEMCSFKERIPVSAGNFLWNSVLCVNIGLGGVISPPENTGSEENFDEKFHWIYFPEEKFPFYRVGSFSNVSKEMCPEGHSSIWVEISYRDKRPGKRVVDRSINLLDEVGFIQKDKVDLIYPIYLPYGYPIYTLSRKENISEVKKFLQSFGIKLAGRFGGWKYSYMEESILQGRVIAEEICQG